MIQQRVTFSSKKGFVVVSGRKSGLSFQSTFTENAHVTLWISSDTLSPQPISLILRLHVETPVLDHTYKREPHVAGETFTMGILLHIVVC